MPICTTTLKNANAYANWCMKRAKYIQMIGGSRIILHNIMLTVTLNYASISAVYVDYAMKTCFYTYATIADAVLCIYRHALLYIMYIEACIRILVPEIYGYNKHVFTWMSLYNIHTYIYTGTSINVNDHC